MVDLHHYEHRLLPTVDPPKRREAGIVTAGVTLTVGYVVSVELLVETPDKAPPLRAMVCYSRGARHGLQFLTESGK